MCGIAGDVSQLARVTLVGDSGVLFDAVVHPQAPVLNYRTQHSGITKEIMDRATHTLSQVWDEIIPLIDGGGAGALPPAILVGHSLHHDLHALKLLHTRIVDTSLLYPHRLGLPYRVKLRTLAAEHLNRNIQESAQGHNSAEDAQAALDLALRLIAPPKKAVPPPVPPPSFKVTAFGEEEDVGEAVEPAAPTLEEVRETVGMKRPRPEAATPDGGAEEEEDEHAAALHFHGYLYAPARNHMVQTQAPTQAPPIPRAAAAASAPVAPVAPSPSTGVPRSLADLEADAPDGPHDLDVYAASSGAKVRLVTATKQNPRRAHSLLKLPSLADTGVVGGMALIGCAQFVGNHCIPSSPASGVTLPSGGKNSPGGAPELSRALASATSQLVRVNAGRDMGRWRGRGMVIAEAAAPRVVDPVSGKGVLDGAALRLELSTWFSGLPRGTAVIVLSQSLLPPADTLAPRDAAAAAAADGSPTDPDEAQFGVAAFAISNGKPGGEVGGGVEAGAEAEAEA